MGESVSSCALLCVYVSVVNKILADGCGGTRVIVLLSWNLEGTRVVVLLSWNLQAMYDPCCLTVTHKTAA